MCASKLLPRESKSGAIGHLAVQAFQAQRPELWRLKDESGDDDAGLDMFVQVIDKGEYAEAFHAQIKGSSSSSYNAATTFVSVRLRVATLNYYKRLGVPVMLVFADLSQDPNPRTCPLFYLWIHEQIEQALTRAPIPAKLSSTVTFRMPTSNRLDATLDVVPYLARDRLARERLQTLSNAIGAVPDAPTAATAFEQLASNIASKGATYLESTLSTSDALWADPTPGTVAWHLKQLNDRISEGDALEGQSLLSRIERLRLRDTQELAELAYLRGGLARLTGDFAGASRQFREAHELLPGSARYLSAWVEERLLRALDSSEVITKLLDELNASSCSTDPKIRTLRARILTTLERFDEAKTELDRLPARYATIERVVWHLMRRQWDDAIRAATAAQTLDISKPTIFTLRILAARARFQKVFALSLGESVPPTGPPILDATLLSELWQEIRDLGRDLASSGWPLNSEFLMDAMTIASLTVGRAAEGLVFLDGFLQARPFHHELQMSRLKLAAHAKKFEIALEAAETITDQAVRVVHLALLHYQAEQFRECLDLVPDLLAVPFDKDDLVSEALAVAAHSARILFASDVEQQCRNRLTEGGFTDRIAILDTVLAASADKAARDSARSSLLTTYLAAPASTALQDHVVLALRPKVREEARVLLDVTRAISNRRQLRPKEVLILAEALATLGQPTEAIAALENALLRFRDNADLMAAAALLCEKNGDVPRARSLLSTLLASPDTSDFARSIYINIAARSGLLEEAAKQLDFLLGAAKTPEEKRDVIWALFSVELHKSLRSTRLLPLAREFGTLADRNSEEQEGAYLQMIMLAGLLSGAEPPLSEREEVQQRAEAYTGRFPNSEYFGAVSVPDGGGAEAIERALNDKFRLPQESAQYLEKLRRIARRGGIYVPFAWRPRVLVPAARTVSRLWELTKQAGRGNPLLSFDMDPQQKAPIDLDAHSRIPLLDLISLLVLTDLDLWPTLFRTFERIAISKSTLLHIQHDEGPLNVSSETMAQLRAAIRTYIDRIDQPGTIDDLVSRGKDTFEEAKSLVKSGRYSLYSDDFAARLYILGEEEHGLNTGQLIRYAQQKGYLSVIDVARRVAQLTRWNIGAVWVDDRHILGCIPAAVTSAHDLKGAIKALDDDANFRSLVSGVWDPPKPYKDTALQVVRVLVLLLKNNPSIDELVVGAIWASWLDKVTLRPEVSLSMEQHLAGVLVLVCWDLRDSRSELARTMWGAFIALVTRRYDSQMDEAREKEATKIVGRMVASGTGSEKLRAHADDYLAAVRRGLTKDTAPDQYLMDGFREKREQQAAEVKRPNK